MEPLARRLRCAGQSDGGDGDRDGGVGGVVFGRRPRRDRLGAGDERIGARRAGPDRLAGRRRAGGSQPRERPGPDPRRLRRRRDDDGAARGLARARLGQRRDLRRPQPRRRRHDPHRRRQRRLARRQRRPRQRPRRRHAGWHASRGLPGAGQWGLPGGPDDRAASTPTAASSATRSRCRRRITTVDDPANDVGRVLVDGSRRRRLPGDQLPGRDRRSPSRSPSATMPPALAETRRSRP